MQLLEELYERDINGRESGKKEVLYNVRKAVRAAVFNRSGKMAMMFVSRDGYHKLPGGGVRRGEDLETALKREIKEETGCEINIRPRSVGAIIEYRDSDALLHISYCYIGDMVGKPGQTTFTQREKIHGFQLEWMDINEAIQVMEEEKLENYAAQFIRKRDLLFLQRVKRISGL